MGDSTKKAEKETVQSRTWTEHFAKRDGAKAEGEQDVALAGGRLPKTDHSPFKRKKPMAEHEPAKVGFVNKKMTMMVMNRMHEPALRAIAGHYGGGGAELQSAKILDMDTEGFECVMEGKDGAKSTSRIEFLEELGGDVTAEGMFIGMAKQASDALDGAMEGIASEHEMVNIRHGQLAKGGEAHVATLNCAALVAELGEEHAGQDGVQTLRHVEGGGASQLVFRPAGLALLRALEPRIASGTLRVVLHDSERSPTLLQRIFRRLDIGDGRSLDDLGVICDAAQWGVAAHAHGRPSFQRCRDVLAIAPSLTLQCIEATPLDFSDASPLDHAVQLPAWGAEEAEAVVAGRGAGWLEEDEAAVGAAAEAMLERLDAAAPDHPHAKL